MKRFEEREEGGAVVIEVSGRLDVTSAPDLANAIASVILRRTGRLVLDCSEMSYIDSSGAQAVLVGAKNCDRAGHALVLAGLRHECRRILETTGLLPVLTCRPTLDEALEALSASHSPPLTDRLVEMEMEVCRVETAAVLSLKGRLNMVSSVELEARVSALVDDGETRVLLDCGEMSYVNSAGLRSLLICARMCRSAGGTLALAALGPACLSVFAISGFLSIIDHHETREAALAALRKGAAGQS